MQDMPGYGGERHAKPRVDQVEGGYPVAPQQPGEPTVADAAGQQDATRRRGRTGSAIREILQTVLIAAILFFGVRFFILPYEVDGSSMMPNLENHDRVLVNRQAYTEFDLNTLIGWIPGVGRDGDWEVTPFGDLERGDVVVLEPPVEHDEPFIKRVVGLPGDTVTFDGGYVYINGEQLDEAYIPDPITECDPARALVDTPTCDVTVPEGYVYVMGDNRTRYGSEDSRMFGVVAIDDLIGKAFLINWPFDRIGPIRGED
jgi:signal peptidase I